MTLASATISIFSAIAASWGTATPIAWPNHPFDPKVNATSGYWIRPVIKVPITEIGELGHDGVGLRSGVLMVSLFAPPGAGSKTLNLLADKLEAFLRRRQLDDLWLDEPTSSPVGNDPNGYYHILMTCDWHCFIGDK